MIKWGDKDRDSFSTIIRIDVMVIKKEIFDSGHNYMVNRDMKGRDTPVRSFKEWLEVLEND